MNMALEARPMNCFGVARACSAQCCSQLDQEFNNSFMSKSRGPTNWLYPIAVSNLDCTKGDLDQLCDCSNLAILRCTKVRVEPRPQAMQLSRINSTADIFCRNPAKSRKVLDFIIFTKKITKNIRRLPTYLFL